MVALTYGEVRVPSAETAPANTTPAGRAETAAPRKHWFWRLMDAMMEARLQQARREIQMHTKLIPYTYDEQGNRIVKTRMNEPFGGW